MSNKQRSAETFRPFAIISQQQQQQQSSYFSSRGGSSDSTTISSLPTTPQIFHSIVPKSTDGYESDSSEDGRKPSPHQILGLRVINPDEQDTILSMDSGKIQESLVTPSSLDGSPSETEWKMYQNRPELPSHLMIHPTTQSELQLSRRESKTASEPNQV